MSQRWILRVAVAIAFACAAPVAMAQQPAEGPQQPPPQGERQKPPPPPLTPSVIRSFRPI